MPQLATRAGRTGSGRVGPGPDGSAGRAESRSLSSRVLRSQSYVPSCRASRSDQPLLRSRNPSRRAVIRVVTEDARRANRDLESHLCPMLAGRKAPPQARLRPAVSCVALGSAVAEISKSESSARNPSRHEGCLKGQQGPRVTPVPDAGWSRGTAAGRATSSSAVRCAWGGRR